MLNADYRDILQNLAEEKCRFLLIGAYAMAAHGFLRGTVDMEIWVEPAPQNDEAVFRALRRFGAPLHDLTLDDLAKEDTVFQIGVAPCRIDIVTGVSGLTFEAAFARSEELEVDGLRIPVLSLDDLICNKRATGRSKDLLDADALENLRE